MSGRILIIDHVATNRIVLKVKMMAAQYMVDTCETFTEATDLIARAKPDLILMNLQDQMEEGYAYCRALRDSSTTRDVAIVSTGSTQTARARFRALDAGADDVLPRPISDALLLSRVRSLLRRRNANFDLLHRDSTGHGSAFGFEEDAAPRLAPARVSVVSYNAVSGFTFLNELQDGLKQPVQLISGARQFATMLSRGTPDVLVVNGADGMIEQAGLLQMVCDFRARDQTRHAAQLVIVREGDTELAAMLLDLGAADIIFEGAPREELVLRTQRLIRSKTFEDRLRARVREGLQAAVTDPLTGLSNRRHAEAHLQRLARHSRDSGQPYALIMIDLDHFKTINDRFGHAGGDRVLRELSKRLQSAMQNGELVARIGGEEFLVALPDTDILNAEKIGQRLRKLIGGTPFSMGRGYDPLTVTASVGIAVHSDAMDQAADDTALGQVFERADAALYSAKSAGRDAVSVWSSAA
ncbi:diguanylate cyclase [Yoonia sp. R2331]|uniref:diguanylate cyclase domain-containing protein n=1 Tax=Yoonia sp. R2331 TaxID=3237238 RepID=UPI0034E4F388